MVEITVRGKAINPRTHGFIKGAGISVIGSDLHDAKKKLEELIAYPSPAAGAKTRAMNRAAGIGKDFMIRPTLRIAPPNREPGSSMATATLCSGGGNIIGMVVIDFDA